MHCKRSVVTGDWLELRGDPQWSDSWLLSLSGRVGCGRIENTREVGIVEAYKPGPWQQQRQIQQTRRGSWGESLGAFRTTTGRRSHGSMVAASVP